jgi:hypothetical protein
MYKLDAGVVSHTVPFAWHATAAIPATIGAANDVPFTKTALPLWSMAGTSSAGAHVDMLLPVLEKELLASNPFVLAVPPTTKDSGIQVGE